MPNIKDCQVPYKQRVTGSNPVTPTKARQKCRAFLFYRIQRLHA